MENQQHLQKLIDSQKTGLNKEKQSETKSMTLLTDSAITRLFNRLGSIFPSSEYLLRDPERLRDMKEVWGAGLSKAGITDLHMIGKGLDYGIKNGGAFMPSLPIFISWCKVGSFPPIDESYKLFMGYLNNGDKPDCEIVQHCILNVDLHKARNGMIDTRKHFGAAYKRAVDMKLSGFELDTMQVYAAIEQVKEPVLEPDAALSFIDDFLERHTDKTWANDIND